MSFERFLVVLIFLNVIMACFALGFILLSITSGSPVILLYSFAVIVFILNGVALW